MANNFISPAVFTRENDLSFLPQGIAEIGAAFIGPFVKGPAFRPVVVDSLEAFQATYGDLSPDFYTPYAVNSYLKEASKATIVRVLGLNGYDDTLTNSLVLLVTGSGAITRSVALLHPTRVGGTLYPTATTTGTAALFSMTISGSNGTKTFTSLSLDTTSARYITKVLGNSPLGKYDAYVYADFPTALNAVSGALIGSASVQIQDASGDLMLSGSVYGAYDNAQTPWIRSQLIGAERFNLFQLYALSDGNASNTDVKITIANIRPATTAGEYGTFSILVRDFNDTDTKMSILEQFDNLTLDATSVNFVAQRIGTARTIIDANNDIYLDGDWPNNSKYVYVNMALGIEELPIDCLPYGFAPLNPPINRTTVPAPSYVTTRYYTPNGSSVAVANSNVVFGYDFTSATNLSYLNPLPSGSTVKVGIDQNGNADAGFDLLTSLAAADLTDLTPTTASSLRRFSVPLQGGFDGQNPATSRYTGASITATNTMGFDLSNSTSDGATAYVRAIRALANPDAWDINLLIMPGVVYSQHTYVATQGVNLCESRGDCFYILDGDVLGATVSSVVNATVGLNTNYAATYHPWVKVRDINTGKTIWVPPSVVMCGVYAFNDKVAAPWFAPAGLNRGGIAEALQVRTRLDQSNRDDLYSSRINPIALFPAQGITVWGQKTLQHLPSALDRVNVRRLMIEIKKFLASTARYLIFEQDTQATRNRFLSIANPYLANIQQRSGLYAYKVVMDDSNNTADLIDRNILVGDIYLKPTRTAEFISLNFNILATGATIAE